MRRRRLPGEAAASDRWIVTVRCKSPLLVSTKDGQVAALGVKGHHVVTQQKLRQVAKDRGLSFDEENALVWDVRNGVPASARRHDRHHSYHERVTREELARHFPEVLEFVAEYELGAWFDRFYPEEVPDGES